MTSKAARIRAKRAQAALQAVCAVSGVCLSAAAARGKSKRLRAVEQTDPDVMRPALSRMCRIMGWPDDEAGRKRARDQRLATLYGRLAVAGRIDSDAYDGIREWEGLDLRYRREVLGTATAVEHDRLAGTLDPQERIRALTNEWMAAQGVIGSWHRTARELLAYVIAAPGDVAPADVSPDQAKAVEVIGHALVRHFK